MPYRETTVFRSHDPKYYTTSNWLAPETCKKHTIQGDHCVWETPYRESTVFRFHGSKLLYYLRLPLARKQKKSHTGRPLCFGNTIQGDHCVLIPWFKNIILPQIASGPGTPSAPPYRETTVFGKHHTGRPLCSDPMIKILYYLGLACPRKKKTYRESIVFLGNTIQGDHCVLIPWSKIMSFTRGLLETNVKHI